MKISLLAFGLLVAASVGTAAPRDRCTATFIKYVPSPFEQKWKDNIESWQWHVCDHLREDQDLVKQWITFTSEKLAGKPVDHHMSDSKFWKVFSYFEYSLKCGSESPVIVKEPIEPLVGFIRDPVPLCKFKGIPNFGLMAWEFLLLMDMKWRRSSTPRLQLYDLGASIWGRGSFPSSQEWFYRQYVKNGGYSIDRSLMWEAKTETPATIFSEVDSALLPHFQYFNMPVSADPAAKMHPWNFVKQLATGKDRHVVVKLDIDTPEIENKLMEQLLEDEALWKLVDEAFYEHHTKIPEMRPFWGSGVSGDLSDSYRIFAELRNRGIRMHGWP